MFTSLLIAVAPLAHPSDPGMAVQAGTVDVSLSSPLRSIMVGTDELSLGADFKEMLKEAGKDPEKLWALYEWALEDKSRKKYRKRVLKAVIKADPEHEEARKLLGHVFYDGKWFDSKRARDKYATKLAKERGWVKFGDDWVEPADVPFLAKGFVKDKYGDWVDPIALKRKAEGWKQQDLVWIPPAEFKKMDEGLWKCDDKWLPLDAANEWHDDLESPWKIPTKRAIVWATTTRETAMKAAAQAELAWYDMQKVFGYGSGSPVPFMLVKDQAEYLRFMDGDPEYEIPQVDVFGVSGHQRAAFADLWFDFEEETYNGMGCTYWDDEDENGDAYGIHDARFAYGLSYVEAIDPCYAAAKEVLDEGDEEIEVGDFLQARYGSHRIERWFRWGAANYASRWFKDQTVKQGGNPKWAFEWSASNLRSQGGLADLDEVFEFNVQLENDSTSNIIMTAGIMVAYMVDGGNPEMSKLLTQLQRALEKGEDVEKIFDSIRNTLTDSEEEIRAFGDL